MNLETIRERLQLLSLVEVRGTFVRLVPYSALAKITPPDWLFTSRKPNRYNPAGTECVYFADEGVTAQSEYESYGRGWPGENQPFVTYYAEVQLGRVLDLHSAKTLKTLGLRESDLFAQWRTAKRPTVTQLIGQAINEDSIASAIRYPSKAAKEAGFSGTNIVVFRDCIQKPDFVQILGSEKKPLQKWP